MYAIVDIETTGGSAEDSAITEVAIIIFDGNQITHRYETLINPECIIPHYITSLTGISNPMVQKAPIFSQVASDIYDLLKSATFVAHNVNFDYSFLLHHLKTAGYSLNVKKVCTVRYARKVIPGLKSYSLGNLCAMLDIDNDARHRAGGDAAATTILFTKLLELDKDRGFLTEMIQGKNKEMFLPPNMPVSVYDNLPYLPGVYYWHDHAGKIIYIGKAKNIKFRIQSHFSNNRSDLRKQDMLRRVYNISYVICASDLHACIEEAIEIKRVWPELNRSQKRQEHTIGLYLITDGFGAQRAILQKKKTYLPAVAFFPNLTAGYAFGRKLAEALGISPESIFIGSNFPDTTPQFIEAHNAAFAHVPIAVSNLLPSFAIIQRGIDNDGGNPFMVGMVVVQGSFYGMGKLLQAPTNYADLLAQMTPQKDNAYVVQLLTAHATANELEVLLP